MMKKNKLVSIGYLSHNAAQHNSFSQITRTILKHNEKLIKVTVPTNTYTSLLI